PGGAAGRRNRLSLRVRGESSLRENHPRPVRPGVAHRGIRVCRARRRRTRPTATAPTARGATGPGTGVNLMVAVPAAVSNAPNAHSPVAKPGLFTIEKPPASKPGVVAAGSE